MIAATSFVAAPSATPASGARIPSSVVKGITTFFQMVATDDHVYLSPGPPGSAIAVMDHDGSQHGRIGQVPGASGLAVHDDTLYVGATGSSTIERFDLMTDPPTRLSAWDTSDLAAPSWVAVAGGYLWFVDCADVAGTGVLGRIDLSTGTVTDQTPSDGTGDWRECPSITVSDFAPDLLFLQNLFSTGGMGAGFDVSTGAPVLEFEAPIGIQAVEVMPDPASWATSYNGGVGVFPLGEISTPDEFYDPGQITVRSWNGLAVTDARGGMIAMLTQDVYNPELIVWKIGTKKRFRTFNLEGYASQAFPDAVAFSPDGSRLFAANGALEGRVRFSAVDPWRLRTRVSVVPADAQLSYGERTDLKVVLKGGDTNRTVRIWRRAVGTPRRLLATLDLPSDGRATIRVRPLAHTTYVATYAGDASWEPARSRGKRIEVAHVIAGRMLRSDEEKGMYALYESSSRIFYAARGTPVHAGEPFTVELSFYRNGGWRDGGTSRFAQDSRGTVTIYVERGGLPAGRYRFRALYPQDPSHLEGISRWSYFRLLA